MTTPAREDGTYGRLRSSALTRSIATNLGAQGGALASVAVASLMVARVGGPAVVGEYALLRVLPWLFGVVFSCGLPTASAFFLAGDHAGNVRLRPTLSLMAIVGSVIGMLAWLVCSAPFQALFFKQMSLQMVAIMAIAVATQLVTVTTKGCCQGSGDIAGANLVIVAEELWFVFCYPAVLILRGDHGANTFVTALIVSGALSTLTGLWRLRRRGFFAGWGMPSGELAKRVAAFGARGQLGNLLWLMNLRLDFILIAALAGPAELGIYAIASKFAELMRLVPTAINYVLYPRFANLDQEQATSEARKLLPRAAALTLLMAPFLAVFCYFTLPLLYGDAFRPAVAPAEIIIIGLSIEGAAAVASAYLLGRGRPGLNSLAMGAGAVITITLDLILIPRYGAMGGAITSAVTYLSTTVMLIYLASWVARGGRRAGAPGPGNQDPYVALASDQSRAPLRSDTILRRSLDLVMAGVALLVVSPLLLTIALVVRLSSGRPVLFKQIRVGRSGEPFTMLKFRTMVRNADRLGSSVTDQGDPRITRVGAWLRASKLDELPQLLNVVKGDMTLVGPRPEVPQFFPFYDEAEMDILSVRPGLTGAGQIVYTEIPAAAHGETDDADSRYVGSQMHPKLAVDLEYLRRRSILLDLRIVLSTIAIVLGLTKPKPKPKPATELMKDASVLEAQNESDYRADSSHDSLSGMTVPR